MNVPWGEVQHRQNAGADFRISKGGSGNFYLDIVRVLLPQHAPTLRASRAGDTVVLSWPASTIGFVLQSETTLFPPSWTDVTNAVAIAGPDQTVTNTVSAPAKFFRLRSF